jgi:hypothetical protein
LPEALAVAHTMIKEIRRALDQRRIQPKLELQELQAINLIKLFSV